MILTLAKFKINTYKLPSDLMVLLSTTSQGKESTSSCPRRRRKEKTATLLNFFWLRGYLASKIKFNENQPFTFFYCAVVSPLPHPMFFMHSV